jgi:hypothetical protein
MALVAIRVGFKIGPPAVFGIQLALLGAGTRALESWQKERGLWMLAAVFAAMMAVNFGCCALATDPFAAGSPWVEKLTDAAVLLVGAIGTTYFAAIAYGNLTHTIRRAQRDSQASGG